jgi:hypothetical protein
MMIVLPVGRNGNDDEVCCRSRGGIGRLIGHEHGFVSVLSVSVGCRGAIQNVNGN